MNSLRASPLILIAIFVLAALNVGLAALAWRSFAGEPLVIAAPKTASPPPAAAPASPLFTPPPLASFTQTLSRPVMFKTRKPYVSKVNVVPAAAGGPVPKLVQAGPDLRAGGVILTGDQRRIFIVSGAQPLGLWVAEGEIIEGWTMVAIDANGALVKRNDIDVRIDLYR